MIQTDDNDITVDVVVEAIIKNNNDNLLKRFISELEYVKIIDGALVTEVKEHLLIPIFIQVSFISASTCSCDNFFHPDTRFEMRLHPQGIWSQSQLGGTRVSHGNSSDEQ